MKMPLQPHNTIFVAVYNQYLTHDTIQGTD